MTSNGDTIFPSIWYPVPFVVADGWRGRTLLLSKSDFLSFLAATGTTPDPARGHIGLNAADCAYGPAAGVTFTLDSSDANTV